MCIRDRDEYEVIRLVDLEKKTHEQCSAQMDVSRTTVTEIYESARYKLAPVSYTHLPDALPADAPPFPVTALCPRLAT